MTFPNSLYRCICEGTAGRVEGLAIMYSRIRNNYHFLLVMCRAPSIVYSTIYTGEKYKTNDNTKTVATITDTVDTGKLPLFSQLYNI